MESIVTKPVILYMFRPAPKPLTLQDATLVAQVWLDVSARGRRYQSWADQRDAEKRARKYFAAAQGILQEAALNHVAMDAGKTSARGAPRPNPLRRGIFSGRREKQYPKRFGVIKVDSHDRKARMRAGVNVCVAYYGTTGCMSALPSCSGLREVKDASPQKEN